MAFDIKTLVKLAHQNAVEHGWWDGAERSPLELIALMHSELSEAVEELRKGTPPIYQNSEVEHFVGKYTGETAESKGKAVMQVTPDHPFWDPSKKPEGELIELADVVIRIMDYCGKKGYDLEQAVLLKHAYNTSRPYRHGGKKY